MPSLPASEAPPRAGSRVEPPTDARLVDREKSWLERFAPLLATLAAVLPFVTAAARAVAHHWFPTGDNSFALIRARDVFTVNTPLIGYWSSATQYTHVLVNHPGPLLFDLLAVPVRLFGDSGVAVGMAAINIAAVAATIMLLRRVAGLSAALLGAAALASLALSLGSEVLIDPWSAHGPIFPFIASVVGAWAATRGEPLGLFVSVAGASLAAQIHLSYVVLAPTVGAVGLVAYVTQAVVASRRAGQDDRRPVGGRRRASPWVAVGLAGLLGLALWAQPLYEQYTRHPGNMTELVRASKVPPPSTPRVRDSIGVMGSVVARPPFWLPPSYQSPNFTGAGSPEPLWVDGGALAVLGLVMVGLAADARRRHDTTAIVGLAAAVLLLGLSFVSIKELPLRIGYAALYLRWLWPVAMLVWLFVAIAAYRSLASVLEHRGAARGVAQRPFPHGGRRPLLAGAAVLLVAGLSAAAVPYADHGSATIGWSLPAARRTIAAVMPQLDPSKVYAVQLNASAAGGSVGPAVIAAMQAHHIRFVTLDSSLIRQLGPGRDGHDHHADATLIVLATPTAGDLPPVFRIISRVSGLTGAEIREQARLRASILASVRSHGGIHILPQARAELRNNASVKILDDAVRATAADPDSALTKGWLARVAALEEFLDKKILADVDHRDLARYLDLSSRTFDGTTVAIGPAPGHY